VEGSWHGFGYLCSQRLRAIAPLAASSLHTESGIGRLRELDFLLFAAGFDFVGSSA